MVFNNRKLFFLPDELIILKIRYNYSVIQTPIKKCKIITLSGQKSLFFVFAIIRVKGYKNVSECYKC